VVTGSAGRTPWDTIVRHLGDTWGREPEVRHVTCRPGDADVEFAVLRRLLALPGKELFLPHEARRTALTRVDGLLRQTPLLLGVTDVQWCDEGTLCLLDRLIRSTAGRPLTVVLSTAPGALAGAPAAFHELMTQDYCAVTDGTGPCAPMPGCVVESPEVLARYDPVLLRVAQACALLRDTDADLVGALAGLPPGEAGRAMRTARDVGLLPEPFPAGDASPHLDLLLAALDPQEGARMRAQAAEILNDAARPAMRTADLLLGRPALDRPWMTVVLKEAAAEAGRDRPASAVAYLSRLHAHDPQDVTVRADLAAALLDIAPAAAAEHLDSVRRSPHAGPRIRARTAVPLQLASLMTHRTPDTPEGLGEVLGVLEAGEFDPVPAARAWFTSAHEAAPPGPRPRVMPVVRALRTALTGACDGHDPRGTVTDAVSDARLALSCEPPRTAWERVAASRVLGLADEAEAALDHLDRAVADSRRHAEVWAEGHARAARALLLLESGRAHDAAEEAQAASRVTEEPAGRPGLAQVVLALALLARRDIDRAEAVVRRLEGRGFEGSVWEYHYGLLAHALVERERGRAGRALELMERCGASLTAVGIENPVFTTWWLYSAELLLAAGRTSAAADRVELGRQQSGRWPTARSTGVALMARAMVARAAQRLELLAESVRVLAGSSDRHSHARAELRLGLALLEHGDRTAAFRHLRAARTTAARCGLTAVADQARGALCSAGGRSPRSVLSHAERPVAELAAAGATNRDIADALYLTVRTVEYHLTSVYRKLGVAGRADLAAYFPSRGHGLPRRTPEGKR